MFGKDSYDTQPGVITGYSNQRGRFQRELRRIIRNALLLVIICLLFKKFASDGVPTWYTTGRGAVSPNSDFVDDIPVFNESLTDFEDYNVIDIKRLILFIIVCLSFTVPFFL